MGERYDQELLRQLEELEERMEALHQRRKKFIKEAFTKAPKWEELDRLAEELGNLAWEAQVIGRMGRELTPQSEAEESASSGEMARLLDEYEAYLREELQQGDESWRQAGPPEPVDRKAELEIAFQDFGI